MEVNGVGFERGAHENVPDSTNTKGVAEHREPQLWATKYWVFGQNCFWWASTMIKDSGIQIPAAAGTAIAKYNQNVGFTKKYADNESAKQILQQTPQNAVDKAEGFVRALSRKLENVTRTDGGGWLNRAPLELQNVRMAPSRQAPSLLLPDDYRNDHQPAPEVWQ